MPWSPVFRGVCPEGRIEITGEVIKVDERESYGVYRRVMTVLSPEGWAVWGTVPSGVGRPVVLGDTVTFRGTVAQSDGSEAFGFYARPTNFRFGSPEPGYTKNTDQGNKNLPF